MRKFIKYIGILIVPLCILFQSCDENHDIPGESPDKTVIHTIKILNAGVGGNEVVVGTVDENKKEISFPRVHKDTDLSKVRFEAEVSERAALDSETYDFTVATGETQATRLISVVNGKRKRDYYVTIRLDVPVFGADFSEAKRKVYDFSGKGSAIYSDLSGGLTRSVDMDKDNVLIVSRGIGPHLLSIADIKEGKTDSPKMINTAGTSGNVFAVSGGRLVHGHIYICNMATPSATAPVEIYHWTDPTAAPQVIASYKSTDISGYAAGRFGDYMSVNLDESGNGYIYLGVNASQASYKVLRLSVSGFTSVSSPTLINTSAYGGFWASYNQVEGVGNEYIYTGHQGPIMLVDANGTDIYKVAAASIPNTGGSDARIINFNQERYLVMFAVPGAGVITVYDITKGDTTKEALEIFEAGTKNPLMQYSLGGNVAAGTAAGSIGFFKDGNDKLYLLGAGPGTGFAVIECPKKEQD